MKSETLKKILASAGCAVLALSLVACSKNEKKTVKKNHDPRVCITVRNYGKIYVQLSSKYAPKTVDNFMALVNRKFYDGLTFHRVIKGFMIQGGDPKGDGTGGSGKTIKGEFKMNGVTNKLSHKRGVISMARSMDMNSASSQFFIMHRTDTQLDGSYASFGWVTKGMSVVDAIAEDTKTQDSNGTVAKKDQPVIESIRKV